MDYALLAGGMLALLLGGDLLVRGAVSIASTLGLSPLIIGVTLLGFGTSTPELLTSINAAMQGAPGLAVGNVVGSNIANILLILGCSALIFPLPCARRTLLRDGGMTAFASLLTAALILDGSLGRVEGFALVAVLVAYIAWSVISDRTAMAADAEATLAETMPEAGKNRLIRDLAMTFGGLVVLILGADLVVGSAITIAQAWGVSDTLIGLTVIAVGTSLPELVASGMAALRRQGEVAIGNVLGSNIYNLLGILGVTALVEPLAVPTIILRLDLWIMLAVTAVMIGFAATGGRIGRSEGGILVAGYGGYLAWITTSA